MCLHQGLEVRGALLMCLACAQGMLGTSPEEVAKFLAKTTGLEKAVIGEYLGEREDTAIKVCWKCNVPRLCGHCGESLPAALSHSPGP